MAKFDLRIKARLLRSQGLSVKQITNELGVAKSTCSLWVRDIILSVEQLEMLKKREILGAERGRLKGALIQKERRIKRIEEEKINALDLLGDLSDRDLFILGISLYWAEGSKKRQKVGFVNSDPGMINLIIFWLKKYYKVKGSEIKARVGINEIHKERDNKIKEYWSEKTKIPLKQFTLTSFKKVRNTKVYKNFSEHYGTLEITVLKPTRIYYKIMGLIDCLTKAGSRLASQGVS